MNKIVVITEIHDIEEGTVRSEYPGVLVDARHAFYIDTEYKTVILERIDRVNGEYRTTGGPGSVGFDLVVDDVAFFDRITEMSAVELLAALVRRNVSA
ncbi:hypothetical protein [Paenibacillus durus]|uniref:Uncharacterized protein n=1 Tax=Paenibacillus durus ATCC 35681 TaxID=1333534 RepID=A0A0F7FAL3_PAEDU|nr:hypothetical protein [Paenibacillus durus]AKG35654.1 hypothetical protein VK70_14610 [Paenibacillus durus ATCC 35681]